MSMVSAKCLGPQVGAARGGLADPSVALTTWRPPPPSWISGIKLTTTTPPTAAASPTLRNCRSLHLVIGASSQSLLLKQSHSPRYLAQAPRGSSRNPHPGRLRALSSPYSCPC